MSNTSFKTRPSPELEKASSVFCYSFFRQTEVSVIQEKIHTKSLVNYKKLQTVQVSKHLEIYKSDNIELRKEIHHEFISYIWIVSGAQSIGDFIQYVGDYPDNWLSTFPGKLFTRILISIEEGVEAQVPTDKLHTIFGSNQLIGNMVEQSSARIWTDFYSLTNPEILRVHIEEFSLGPKRRGRLAQNVLELENYRCLAEISFPIAEKIVFELEAKESELAVIVKEISMVKGTNQQQYLLNQLLDLSVVSENWRSETGHRFSATFAYKKIFEDRLMNLDETRVLGYQTFSSFFNRNTMPTFRTCEAANDRLNIFITRIDRAISMLSTRINLVMEQQNNELLSSVDKQNKQQITLQETIEAFAIIAISYNSSALINLFLVSLEEQGFAIDTAFWTSVTIPATVVSSFLIMHFLKKYRQSKN